MSILRHNVSSRRRARPSGLAPLAVLLLVLLLALVAPLISMSPNAVDGDARLQFPSAEHFWGTDHYGRDIWARALAAGRNSAVLVASVTCLATVLGIVVGVVSGYHSRVDAVVARVIDGMLAFPPFVLAIALVAAFGGSSTRAEITALVLVFTPLMTRMVRGVTLQIKNQGYIAAAVAAGARTRHIMSGHVIPNGAAPIIVLASFIAAEVILADAALSFLGLGAQAPTPTWGNMIAEARPYLVSAPHFALIPGLLIVVVVVSLHLFGDSLRTRFSVPDGGTS